MRQSEPSGPPRLWSLVLQVVVPRRYRDAHLGDLEEEYRTLARSGGVPRANAWYRKQVLTSLKGAFALRLRARPANEGTGWPSMETVWQDVRYGVRGLRTSVSYTVVAVATLALAIGVNTAIFSIVSLIAFADLPIEDLDTVGVIQTSSVEAGIREGGISYPEYLDLRDRVDGFESLAVMGPAHAVLTRGSETVRVAVNVASPNLFETVGTGVVLGRGFREGDDRVGAADVMMLAHSFWAEDMGSSPDVIGSTLRLDGREHTILGVVTPKMEFGDMAAGKVWVPIRRGPDEGRGSRDLTAIGRLPAGGSFARVSSEVETVSRELADRYPQTSGSFRHAVVPASQSLVNEETEAIITLLGITVALVLLLACSNVANISLARASGRSRELAVRSALGAGRTRLARQLLTESVIVGVAAGAAGLALAYGLLDLLVAITRGRHPVFLMMTIDRPVLVFTTVVSLLAVLGFGLAPALRSSRTEAGEALKESGVRSGGGRRGRRVRDGLVVAQIALALTLMIVAGVFSRSVAALYSQEPGFDSPGVLSMVLDLPEYRYRTDEAVMSFFDGLGEVIEDVQGVTSFGLTSARPIDFADREGATFMIEGRSNTDERRLPWAILAVARPGYMETMRIPLVQGRFFDPSDRPESTPTAIVSRAMANRFWGSASPVGDRIRLGGEADAPWRTVVGVVADVEEGDGPTLERPPHIYIPHRQEPRRTMVLVARADGDPTLLAGPIREAIRTLDPLQPIDDVRTMDEVRWDSIAAGVAVTTLFGIFALFALAMAAAGIYGVMSYAVSERRREISLRMALGAARRDVLGMVLGQGGRILLVGTGLGLLGALALSVLLGSVVYGLSPRDPLTFGVVTAVLGLAAILANVIPALRATRIEPMAAMRVD